MTRAHFQDLGEPEPEGKLFTDEWGQFGPLPSTTRALLPIDRLEARLAVLRCIDSHVLDQREFRFLKSARVDIGLAASMDVQMLSGTCAFHDAGFFEMHEDGEPSVLVIPPAEDDLSDLVAFSLADPTLFAPLTWQAFALGQARIRNPATYHAGGALHLHRTPLEFLQSGCMGAVILDGRPESIREHLSGVPRIVCNDLAFARWLRSHFHDASTRPAIFVPKAVARSAA